MVFGIRIISIPIIFYEVRFILLGMNNLAEILKWQADSKGEKNAFWFYEENRAEHTRLSWRELEAQTLSLSAMLNSKKAENERVLLLCPTGAEFIAGFMACLFSGAIAVPLYPPRTNRNLQRIEAVIKDSEAKFALTTSPVLKKIRKFENAGIFKKIEFLEIDSAKDFGVNDFKERKITPSRTAFLQYTSGSTSLPKGVIVTHENLMHNQEAIKRGFNQNEDSIIVSWLPLFHDMGLIGNVLQTIYTGSECVLMPPAAFLQKPVLWLKAISDFRATTGGAPTFGYELCSRITDTQETENLDLSSWQTAFCGAETVRIETLRNFARKFAANRFSEKAFAPCYGLAEATLLVAAQNGLQSAGFDKEGLAGNRLEAAERPSKAVEIADCGKIVSDLKVEIVNPETFDVCGENEIGEIWISGKSVASGYWKNETATKEIFQARINGANDTKYLRTGDFGFKRNDSLFITGRLKDLIIVRGRNYYPTDLEFTAASASPALSVSALAAVSLTDETNEKVWLIAEADQKTDFSALAEQIVKIIAEEHDLRLSGIAFIRRGAIPKTSSGKIKRGVCRELVQSGSLNTLYVWTENGFSEEISPIEAEYFPEVAGDAQSVIKRLVAERLGIEEDRIFAQNSLIELGIDSLTATEISLKAAEKFGLQVSVSRILSGEMLENIANQAVFISPKKQKSLIENSGDAVSHGQQALYFLQQLEPKNAAYNISVAVQLEKETDADLLEKAIQLSIETTEQLRSNFRQNQNRICRIERNKESFELARENFNLSSEKLTEAISRTSLEPFDLENDCLLRASLFKNEYRNQNETIFLLTAHHIICDFWSLRLLAEEIGENYTFLLNGQTIDERQNKPNFSEFAKLEKDLLANESGKNLWNYWRDALTGKIEPLDLPTDFPRPANQSFKGAAYSFEIAAESTERLEKAAQKNGVTLFVVVLAAYQIFLSKYAGQDKFLIGNPFANRTDGEAAKTFGYFVNTLPICADFSSNLLFSDLLSDLSREISEATGHAAFPFSLMIERLSPERDPARSPLFQTIFSWQQTALGDKNWSAVALGKVGAEIKIGEFLCRSFPLRQQTAQFDISLQSAKIDNRLSFVWQYNTDLFKVETIKRMTEHFWHLLDEIAKDQTKKVSAYELLSKSEKIKQIKDWNATERAYPKDVLLHKLIEKQVEQTPDNIALEFEGKSLTYSELNARANQLAHHLREKGIKPEMIVGVALERSPELVIALLGIVKSGAAYLPLDPSYPHERFAYMLKDARVSRLITNKKIAVQKEVGAEIETIFLDADSEVFKYELIHNPPRIAVPNNAAYVIYTSGSTGKPKGAINSHANIVNRLLWMQEAFDLSERDAVLQKTPFSFDVSVWEFFWTLMFGARLVIAKPDGHTDSHYLSEIIEQKLITTLHFVPSMLNLFLQEVNFESGNALKRVICSGEALPFELQQNFFKKIANAELHNLYGPTEAAIDVSWHICERESCLQTVPIGKPIANTQLYVLDENFAPVPIGVAGELYIGGANVGRGYLNKPALTAEKFVPDPFIEKIGARLYQTGDIVRYLEDGSIDYLERRDGQIKLRGQRIELGEIQTVLLLHPEIFDAVVIVRTEPENNHVALIAYYLSKKDLAFNDLREFLQKRLPSQMIPSYFIRLEKMPLSPNGKLDRKALLLPKTRNEDKISVYAAPTNETQTILISVWREVLGNEKIGIDDNFFALGGDSIRSIQVRAKARENGLDFELQELFRYQTVRSLSVVTRYYKTDRTDRENFVLNDEDKKNLPVNTVAAYPLTRLQTGLIFHQEHDRDYEIYVTSLRVSSKFDEPAMHKAVRFVTERHEILRSFFEMSQFSEPLQVVLENVEPNFEIKNLTKFSEKERELSLENWLKTERTNAFIWTNAPLARFTIHLLGKDIFQITLSEPVLDGWSVATLLSDLLTVYTAFLQNENPPELPVPPSNSEYVRLEKDALASESQQDFWKENLNEFQGCIIAKAANQNESNNKQTERIYLEIPLAVSQSIFDFTAETNVPLKSVLLAAHLRAISILTAKTDVCTALLYNGRPETTNAERAVGLFLNAVPFRLDLENLSFAEIVKKSFAAETDLLPHRRFPLSEILRLHNKRNLFDTAFNYTHFHAYQSLQSIEEVQVTDIYASDQTYFPLTSQFNLNHESNTPGIRLAIDFRPAKISETQAREFADCVSEILHSIGKKEMPMPLVRTARANSSAISAEIQTTIKNTKDLTELIKKIEQMSDEEARILKEKLTKNSR